MNTVKIRYCTGCRWLLRSAWMAQELLSTFESDIDDLVLSPASQGRFEIFANETLIWSRERDGGFPDISHLKRLVRDVIAPERELGHNDRPATT